MEDNTNNYLLTSVITFILTFIFCFFLFGTVATKGSSKGIYQMGLCMEQEGADLLKCQTIVDSAFEGTNEDK